MLVNLLTNATRFASSRIVVDVAAADDNRPTVTVSDDGPGFPEELLPRAFDRFARAAGPRGRSDGGSGLGLAIVSALATAQGATVTVGNGPPLGGGFASSPSARRSRQRTNKPPRRSQRRRVKRKLAQA